MSAISTLLPSPPDGFSTTLSTSISSSALTIALNSVVGLGTEGIGVLFKKGTDGSVTAGSIEYVHWTGVSGSSITLSDTGDRGLTGSSVAAQSYANGDYFEVWVSSYYYNSFKDAVDTSSTLASNSDVKVPSQKATKTYVDSKDAGWASADALTYASADAPTFTVTATGDQTGKYSKGMKMKFTQTQALSYYWTFNTSSAADLGTATMANVGTPTYTAGKFGNALTLASASSQALSITDAAGFKPTGEFTIGMWIKPSSTGATQGVFQSYTETSNIAGISMIITSAGLLTCYIGKNTGTGTGDFTQVSNAVSLIDATWHYIVLSYRNNYVQLYVDGKLVAGSYCVTPAYNATNYVRIGCSNTAGSNANFFNGQIDDLFIINGYALDQASVKKQYLLASAQGVSDITVTKYGLINADPTYSSSTTLSLYMGTDYTLTNAAISSPYFSVQKSPFGFPMNTKKWSVEFSNVADVNTGVVALITTITNIGSFSLPVPIGDFILSFFGSGVVVHAGAAYLQQALGLSTTTNSYTDKELTSFGTMVSASSSQTATPFILDRPISLDTKKTFYLNTNSNVASSTMYLQGATQRPTIIRAVSTLI